jgi:uncharacterized lipoprotein YbaY
MSLKDRSSWIRRYQRYPIVAIALLLVSDSASAQFGYPAAEMSRVRDGAPPPTVPLQNSFGWGSSTVTNPIAPTYGSSSNPDWQLGITVDNTVAGVVVRNVQPNSAAARSGIEVGDIILTVGGFQVGYVDNRLFDVGQEIGRRVDAQGKVRMLVQDLRTAKVDLVEVNLQNVSTAVRGDVVWRDYKSLPAGSTLQVRIDNISRPYQAIGGGILNTLITQMQPIPYELNLDPSYLVPGERYQIQAMIRSGDQVLYTTQQPVAIDPTRGAIPNLRLELIPVGVVTASGNYSTAYSTNVNLVNDYYQRYLGRTPTQSEMTAWLEYFARGKSEEDLPVTLLSSTEFFERAGSTDARFIDRMFRVVVNRAPSNEETNQWLQKLLRLGPQGRSQIVKEFWRAASPR